MSSQSPSLQSFIHGGFPLPLCWQGWHTTTHELHCHGWEIHADERLDYYGSDWAVTLGVTSPDKSLLIAGTVCLSVGSILGAKTFATNSYVSTTPYPLYEALRQRPLEMKQYSCRDKVFSISNQAFDSLYSLRPVSITDETPPFKSFSDMKVFKYKDTAPEIFIPPDAVDRCLDMILKIQYPDQQAIKKSLIVPEKRTLMTAQLFTLAT